MNNENGYAVMSVMIILIFISIITGAILKRSIYLRKQVAHSEKTTNKLLSPQDTSFIKKGGLSQPSLKISGLKSK